jgi:hypothetical protein
VTNVLGRMFDILMAAKQHPTNGSL